MDGQTTECLNWLVLLGVNLFCEAAAAPELSIMEEHQGSSPTCHERPRSIRVPLPAFASSADGCANRAPVGILVDRGPRSRAGWSSEILGRPAPNAHKYFSAVEIESLARDRDWLDKATRVLGRHVREKNQTGRQGNDRLAA